METQQQHGRSHKIGFEPGCLRVSWSTRAECVSRARRLRRPCFSTVACPCAPSHPLRCTRRDRSISSWWAQMRTLLPRGPHRLRASPSTRAERAGRAQRLRRPCFSTDPCAPSDPPPCTRRDQSISSWWAQMRTILTHGRRSRRRGAPRGGLLSRLTPHPFLRMFKPCCA